MANKKVYVDQDYRPTKPVMPDQGDYMNLSGDDVRVAYPLFRAESDGAIPISPLQLEIMQISTQLAKSLNALWHSRLPYYGTGYLDSTRVCYGAMFANRWYACAIWGMPISPSLPYDTWLELRRMAIAEDAPKNTASRMIAVMTLLIKRKFPEIVMLISYQDCDVHKGIIYKASGWKMGNYHKGASRIRSQQRYGVAMDNFNKNAYSPKVRWQKEL